MGQFPSFHDIFWHFQNTLITQFLWSFLGWLTAEWTNLWSYTGHCSQHCDHWAAMFGAWNNVQTIHRTVYLPCPPPEAAWRNHDHQHFSWWCPLVVWLLYVVVIFPIFAAPPMATMASVWRVGLIPSAGGSLALDNLEISLLISWGCKNCVDTLYTTTHR